MFRQVEPASHWQRSPSSGQMVLLAGRRRVNGHLREGLALLAGGRQAETASHISERRRRLELSTTVDEQWASL